MQPIIKILGLHTEDDVDFPYVDSADVRIGDETFLTWAYYSDGTVSLGHIAVRYPNDNAVHCGSVDIDYHSGEVLKVYTQDDKDAKGLIVLGSWHKHHSYKDSLREFGHLWGMPSDGSAIFETDPE